MPENAWITDIRSVIIYSGSTQIDEMIELDDITAMKITPYDNLIEFFQDGKNVGCIRCNGIIWVEHMKGDDKWWEIDTEGFGLEVDIK